MNNEKTPYQRKLAHPDWQRKRLEIMQRDNFRCYYCFSKDKELHIHHKYYLPGKLPHEHPDSCLVTLCYECHSREEEKLAQLAQTAVLRLRNAGFDAFCIDYLISAAERAANEGVEPYWQGEMINYYRRGLPEERDIIDHELWKIAEASVIRFENEQAKKDNGQTEQEGA